MNKTLRNLALVALAAAPFSAYAEIAGTGTQDDPYQIATAEDLAEVYKMTQVDQLTYFIQTADITMTDAVNAAWIPVLGFNSDNYSAPVVYDGRNHVIKNFKPGHDEFAAPYCYGQSIFGYLIGTVKNLGIVDAELNALQGRAGIVTAYFGNGSSSDASKKLVPVSKMENVYVTGKVKGASGNYVGGLFGTTSSEVEVTNCFVNVEMNTEGTDKGAFAGRLKNATTITNCYVAGTVSGTANLVAGSNAGAVTMNGFILFNTGSETTGLTNAANTGKPQQYTSNNASEGIAEVQKWPAFSDTEMVDGYPALNYALSGAGTEADPYQIGSPEDLANAWRYVSGAEKVEYYFVQTADIDMGEYFDAGNAYRPINGWNGAYNSSINYDGQNHVIDNWCPNEYVTNSTEVAAQSYYYCTSVFGVATGTIMNLGVTNAYIDTFQGAGILGAYGSHEWAENCKNCRVENVFVEGSVKTSYYGGGMFGTYHPSGQPSVVYNCYVNVDVETTGSNRQIAGIVGRQDCSSLSLENVYTAGTVTSANPAGAGLVTGSGTGKVDIYNVVAFNTGVEKAVVGTATGDPVKVATEANKAELIASIIEDWNGFDEGKLNKNGLPALNWQNVEQSGLFDTTISDVEANGPAVYYNLQGVQVANPENGIYIVRRGNKVTKELVK